MLYGHPDQAFYLRQIVKHAEMGTGQIQRELKRLASVGILKRFEQGRHVYYQASENCPIYDDLRGLVAKTIGAPDVLRQVLDDMAHRINVAFTFGSMATGEQHSPSDVDVMVIGDVTFREVSGCLAQAEQRLRRAVNPVVYPVTEFKQKLQDEHHFVTSVMKQPKVFVIGTENELRDLGQQRVA